MRKIVSLLLISSILFVSCTQNANNEVINEYPSTIVADANDQVTEMLITETTLVGNIENNSITDISEVVTIPSDEVGDDTPYLYEPCFEELDNDDLLNYIEDSVYLDLVNSIDTSEYYIEGVSAVYISQEYINELEYNSRKNIFFGYSLDELDEYFQGVKYVFTLNDMGRTVAVPFESYDDTYDRMIRNVAIGTGVILICVVVSAVSGGVGAPAVAAIFATAAETGTTCALSTGVISAITEGAITYYNTGDWDETFESAALAGSEGYMLGAITGCVTGGFSKYMHLNKYAVNDLSIDDVAILEKYGFSPNLIAQFHNMEEAQVFIDAGLKGELVNGNLALIRKDIDLQMVDKFGRTNLQRMAEGLAPLGIDEFGNVFSFQLHHIGQEADATLAILTPTEHSNSVLHGFKTVSEINRPEFDSIRKNFWKSMAQMFAEGII